MVSHDDVVALWCLMVMLLLHVYVSMAMMFHGYDDGDGLWLPWW